MQQPLKCTDHLSVWRKLDQACTDKWWTYIESHHTVSADWSVNQKSWFSRFTGTKEDENNDGVLDRHDRNRDGKPDR